MYGNTMEAAEMRIAKNLEALQEHIGGCREWVEAKGNVCGEPVEFVLWGKLIPTDGLGPRCYDHAADHISHYGLAPRSHYALINLSDLARDIDVAHFPEWVR